MHYSLSISKTALLAEVTTLVGVHHQSVVSINIAPDYGYILQVVNRESVIPLDAAAVAGFARLFLSVAHEEGYKTDKIHTALDVYVKDVTYLLGLGVQKVHQAFTLREQLLTWLEMTLCCIDCMAFEPDTAAS